MAAGAAEEEQCSMFTLEPAKLPREDKRLDTAEDPEEEWVLTQKAGKTLPPTNAGVPLAPPKDIPPPAPNAA